MQFDDRTIEILNSFSTLNPSIKFKKGKELLTCSPLKTVLAKANIETEIEKDFVIGDLNRFMRALSLLDEPEITLEDKYCTISDEQTNIKFVYTSENLIKKPNVESIDLDSPEISFELTNEKFAVIKKAMSNLSLPDMGIEGANGMLNLVAFDSSNTIPDVYKLIIGETCKDFFVVFKSENLKLLPLDYTVAISSKGISNFYNEEVQYWIAVEADQTKF